MLTRIVKAEHIGPAVIAVDGIKNDPYNNDNREHATFKTERDFCGTRPDNGQEIKNNGQQQGI